MTARPPFSTVLQTKDFAVVLRLTVMGRNPTSIAGGNCVSAGLAGHRASPELVPCSRPQQPQSGKPSHELQWVLEQLALEEHLFEQSGGLTVGSRMAYAIDGSHEGQRLEWVASCRQIFADKNMATEHLANVGGGHPLAAFADIAQIPPGCVGSYARI